LATAAEGHLGLWLQQCVGLPFVVYAHGNEVLASIKSGWLKPRLALQRADRVLANSHYTAGLVRQVGVAPDRVEIVNPGCDIENFRPRSPNIGLRKKLLGERGASRVLLTVGNLVARKGHDMVIRALPLLRRRFPELTYLIVGEGPERERLSDLAVTGGVREHVVFAGHVPVELLPEIYALSDVFVMPSRAQLDRCDVEGFGLVYLEANACAKPVVAGRSGGISDAVVDGVTGFLVNPEAPEDIAGALARILDDDELGRRLGEQGRSRVVREFGWPRVAMRIQSIVTAVVATRSRR
jgi:phosphatidylinositol alpha-1,6-mannosyltransferase